MIGDTVRYHLDTLPFKPYSRVIALGLFDGMHQGHIEIIRKTVKMAKLEGLTSTVQTFSGLVKTSNGDVLTLEERQNLLSDMGVDEMLVLDFESVKDTPKDAYMNEILLQKAGAAALVFGYDYTFGKGGEGNAEDLKRFAEQFNLGIKVFGEKTFKDTGRKISTTWLKETLAEGDVELFTELCAGRPFSYEGIVVEGKRLGRQLGFPTVNVLIDPQKVVVKRGVYASIVTIGNKRYGGVTNVGLRPTVEDSLSDVAETFIFDFDEDVYGAKIKVDLYKFLRPETKFNGKQELIDAVEKNKIEAKMYLEHLI